MVFLNWTMLFGTAAIAIPIIIHLLNSRKVQRVTWAAMRFLRASVEQNQRRLRIEDLLLLLLRCALLALLAIMLARPAIGGTAGGLFGTGATTAVLVIDSSYSMSQTDGIHSAFDRAKGVADQIIDGFAGGSKVAVWLNSDAVNTLIPEPTADLALAHSTVAAATRCDRTTDVMPALRRAIDLLNAATGSHKEIDLITDGQASGWKQMADIKEMLGGAAGISTNVILVFSPPSANLTVADLHPVGELLLVHRAVRFAAAVKNNGNADAHDVRVTLKIDGGEPADEKVIASLPVGGTETVSLFARLPTEGFHTITASIPPDRLPADDSRTIAVHALSGLKVLLVDGSPTRDRDSATFYLQRLFAVTGEADAGEAPVSATVVSPAGFQQQALDSFATVVLADVASLSGAEVDALREYVRRGGGLIVFPGDRSNVQFYNQRMMQDAHLLPAGFGDARGHADAPDKLLALQARGFTHPISEIWNDPAAGSPADVSIFKYLPLEPDTGGATGVAGAARVVLEFSDGTPAVMERAYGLGRAIQFAFPASAHWDDLPLHPGVFVPLIFRSLNAIVSRQDESLNLTAGGTFTYHPGPQLLNQEATFIRPGEDANAPHDVKTISLVRNEPTIVDQQTDLAGAYTVTIPDNPPIKFAVQFDPRESIVEPLSADQRRDLSAVARVVDYAGASSLGGAQAATNVEGTHAELWPVLAWIVLALGASEMVCAWWFSRAK